MKFLGSYAQSLKMAEAEEFLDLAFYRPLGFITAKTFARTPITPNQLTLLSLLAGLAAAYCFSFGAGEIVRWGAVSYLVANVLDCADGQLARLQGSGTLLGRVVDGVADYVSSGAIFLGLGVGLATTGAHAWWLVFAAALSTALHALMFDHYQNEFICTVRGEKNFLTGELTRFTDEAAEIKKRGLDGLKTIALSLYIGYLRFQKTLNTRTEEKGFDPEAYRSSNLRTIRMWSALGPTTNRSLLIVCALSGQITSFFWIVVVIGNAWLATCFLLQRRIHRRLGASRIEVSSAG